MFHFVCKDTAKTFCDKKVFYIIAENFRQLIFFSECKWTVAVIVKNIAVKMRTEVRLGRFCLAIRCSDFKKKRHALKACRCLGSVFEQMFKELIHLFIEAFEQAFAQDESVVIHNEQVYNRLVLVIDEHERVGLCDIEAVE